jgi:hypothetical protein
MYTKDIQLHLSLFRGRVQRGDWSRTSRSAPHWWIEMFPGTAYLHSF